MNIVGPRPERPTIFAELRNKIPNYHVRQRVRPGITGFAQVNLEYDSSVEDVAKKLRYDLAYVSYQSVAVDLAIMMKTVPVMLFRDKMLAARPQRVTASPTLRSKEAA
jgi:lipopolysaccharide/colanic/teichoic acid biosynthesis glycosyltransferase